jgi:hypothetical protein
MLKKQILYSFILLFSLFACEPGTNSSPEDCTNGIDDDGDTLIDCSDPECIGFAGHSSGSICETVESICDDGFDNDRDGTIDGSDTDCVFEPVEICNNGLDDDDNTYIDCADFACIGLNGPDNVPCEATEISCNDGFDNDGDGMIDASDFNCPKGIEICNNGIDDNGNNYIDCADFYCIGSLGENGETCEATEISCNDGFDNDGDEYFDCKDINCLGVVIGINNEICEATELSCEDEFDNDGDGYFNCQDLDCYGKTGPPTGSGSPVAGVCEEYEINCTDGYDNDGDGNTDCDDFKCNAYCIIPGSLIITEIMPAPVNIIWQWGEWFELFNSTASDIDLRGLTIFSAKTAPATDLQLHLIESITPVVIPAYSYGVLAINANPAENGGISAVYDYSATIGLGTPDSIGIRTPDGTIIDEVSWNSNFPYEAGKSMNLSNNRLSISLNDLYDSWCTSDATYHTDNNGTPGAINQNCHQTINEICNDFTDNDGDGLIDCGDDECVGETGPGGGYTCQAFETSCFDGIDNDGDGIKDGLDTDCLPFNGSFEYWITDVNPENWIIDPQLGVQVDKEVSIIKNGTASVKLTRILDTNDKTDFGSPLYAVTANTTYLLSMWYYDDDPNGRGILAYTWYDNTQTQIGLSVWNGPDSSDSTEWQHLTEVVTNTVDASYIQIHTRVYGSVGGVVYLDNVSISEN